MGFLRFPMMEKAPAHEPRDLCHAWSWATQHSDRGQVPHSAPHFPSTSTGLDPLAGPCPLLC